MRPHLSKDGGTRTVEADSETPHTTIDLLVGEWRWRGALPFPHEMLPADPTLASGQIA